jgi:hypothetical protein
MNKKIDLTDIDIPKDDIECWERYPKHRWVYELSRLLDAQNIRWSPYEVDSLSERELNIKLETERIIVRQPGFIYLKKSQGQHMFSELYITKGEIKLIRQIDPGTKKELSSLIGEVELRINAFVTLYFQKFTGVITVETFGNEIHRIKLRPLNDISLEANQEVVKLMKRIYKRSTITA